jgi:hypothetical protein
MSLMSSAEVLDRVRTNKALCSDLVGLKEGTMTPHRELWVLREKLEELEARTIRLELLNAIEPDEKTRARISRLKYRIKELEEGGA